MCRNGCAREPAWNATSPRRRRSRARCSALCAPAADASPNVRFGIQDDAWLVHGGGTLDERLDRLEQLGVDVVRFNLHWDQIEPARGEYAWEDSDAVLNGLRGRGIPAVVGIVGTPAWANGGRTPNFAPGARLVRRLRPRRRDALSLGDPVADVERAEPGALAAPDLAERLCPPDPQSRLRSDPCRDPRREGRGRRHRAARARAAASRPSMDPRDARPRGARLDVVRPPSLSVEQPGDAVHRRLRPLRDDHDGHAREADRRGRARRSARSGSG